MFHSLVGERRLMRASFSRVAACANALFAWLSLVATGVSHAQSPVIVTPAIPAAKLGQPYAASVLWGNLPTSYGITGAPNGLANGQNANRLDLFGSISQAGVFDMAVSATNASGSSTPATVRLDVIGTQYATNVTAVAASANQTCAVVGGGVLCFGANEWGQLGDGTTAARHTPVVAIPSGSNATSISMSPTHTCAIVNGGVKCWGRNDFGQLGNNTLVDSATPVDTIPAGSGATALHVNVRTSCAVVQGGVKCWGQNNFSQLGDGTQIDRKVPVTTIAANSGVTTVAVNARYGCATVGGGLMCWGTGWSSRDIQAPYDFNTSATPGYPNDFGPGLNITKVVAGRDGRNVTNATTADMCYVQIVDSSPRVRCMGHVAIRFSGTGLMIDQMLPRHTWSFGFADGLTRNADPPTAIPQSDVTDLDMDSTTWGTRCAVVDGGVRCWSLVNSGWDFLPAQSGATAVAVGNRHVCAIVNGVLKCVSVKQICVPSESVCSNRTTSDPLSFAQGQSGGGTWLLPLSLAPTTAVGAPPPPALGASSIAVGEEHTCTNYGSATLCWGRNDEGQLGNASNVSSIAPVTVGLPSASTSLASGAFHSCAVVNGGVRCWGWNDPTPPRTCPPFCTPPDAKPVPPKRGQLGNGTEGSSNVPVIAIADDSGAIAVAGGMLHSCAIVAGGAVRCWGSNEYGQLGDGTVLQRLSPVPTVPAITGATAIAAGSFHTCALVAGGVKCWGRGDVGGALGHGSTVNSSSAVDAIAPGSGVTAIAAGDLHTCAVFGSGTVKCWGDNTHGQLGDGTTTSRNTPTAVGAIASGATAISAGTRHTCAVVSGGVRCWGANDSAQLGNGNLLATLTPAQTVAANAGISAISSRGHTTCVIASGGVACWGANARGQLGSLAGYQFTNEVWVDSRVPAYPNPPLVASAASPGLGGAISLVLTPPAYTGNQPILDYTVRCGSATVVTTSTNVTISGLTNGASYVCFALARTATGFSANSLPVTMNASLTPQAITFSQPTTPATDLFGFTVSATGGASGNPVVFSSLTPQVCSAGGVNGADIAVLSAGICTIAANQAGNTNFQAALQVTRNVQINPRLSIVRNGNGTGNAVAVTGAAISCGGGCFSYAAPSALVTLDIIADPFNKLVAVSGISCPNTVASITRCIFSMPATDTTVTLTFRPTINLDGLNAPVEYDAATDGLLLLRYLLGYRGTELLAGIDAQQSAQNIENYLAERITANDFDVDGDGFTRATSDGAMILRRMLLRSESNPAVITVGKNPGGGSPLTDAQIVQRIDQLLP